MHIKMFAKYGKEKNIYTNNIVFYNLGLFFKECFELY